MLHLCFLLLTTFQLIINYDKVEGNMLSSSVGEKICNSFGGVKCPFDPYCMDDEFGRDNCRFCPSGNDKNCSYYQFITASSYGKCQGQKGIKYYNLHSDACNGRNECGPNNTDDEDGCEKETACKDKGYISRYHKCPGSNFNSLG